MPVMAKTILIATVPQSTLAPMPVVASSASSTIRTIDFQSSVGSNISRSGAVKRPFYQLASSKVLPASPSISPVSSKENYYKQPYLKMEVMDCDLDDDEDDEDDDDAVGDDGSSMEPPRKRERLTHLSAEEKIFRRKMKNRIAAQSARDRKKAQMVQLEDAVRRLEEENDSLLDENARLQRQTQTLSDENQRLKQQLQDQKDTQDVVRSIDAVEPAEFINVPLPKEQAPTARTMTWLIASALIQLCSKSCAASLPSRTVLKLHQQTNSDSFTLVEILKKAPPEEVQHLWTLIRSFLAERNKPP